MSENKVDVKYFLDEFTGELIVLEAGTARVAKPLVSKENAKEVLRHECAEPGIFIGGRQITSIFDTENEIMNRAVDKLIFPKKKKIGRPKKVTATEAVMDHRKQPRITAERIKMVRTYLEQDQNSKEISVLMGIDLALVNKIIIKLRDKKGAPKDGDDDYLARK